MLRLFVYNTYIYLISHYVTAFYRIVYNAHIIIAEPHLILKSKRCGVAHVAIFILITSYTYEFVGERPSV